MFTKKQHAVILLMIQTAIDNGVTNVPLAQLYDKIKSNSKTMKITLGELTWLSNRLDMQLDIERKVERRMVHTIAETRSLLNAKSKLTKHYHDTEYAKLYGDF